MLPKEHRLQDYRLIEEVKKQGKIYQSSLFGVLIAKNQDESKPGGFPSKFAFIVSTKIDKRAVKRNQLKRLYSEAIKFLLPQIKKGYRFVFLVKKTSLNQKFEEIKRQILESFAQAGLINS